MQKTVSRAFSVVLGVFLFVVAPQWSQADTAGGREQLFNYNDSGEITVSGLLAARDTFSEVGDTDPTYQEAQAFYAVTHALAFLFEDGEPGIDTLKELLEAFGVTRTANDSIDLDLFSDLPTFDESYDPPSTLPNGGDVSAFVQGPLLSRLDEVLTALNAVTSGFSTTIEAQETGDEPIEIDYADIRVLRSWAYMARSFALIVGAYDLSCDLGDLVQLINADMLQLQRDLLNDANPDLLSLQDDGATSLQNAAQALRTAISEYAAAHADIAAGIDSPTPDWRTDHLFAFDSLREVNASAFYLTRLEEIDASINDDRAAILTSTEQNWLLTEVGGSGQSISVEMEMDAEHNVNFGSWHGPGDRTFIWDYGHVQDVNIVDDEITIVLSAGDDDEFGEVIFTGTLSGDGTSITEGKYNGEVNSVEVSGDFEGLLDLDDPETLTDVINFNKIFGTNGATPLNIRAVLPEFNTFNEPIVGTFPPTNDSSPILNGILPSEPQMLTNDDATRNLDLMPTGTFYLNEDNITIAFNDGSFGDWTQGKVFDDINLDDDEETYDGGKDLKSFWMVQDDDYYYMRVVYHYGPYSSGDAPFIRFIAKVNPDSGYEYGAPIVDIRPYSGSGEVEVGIWGPDPTTYSGASEVHTGMDGEDYCVEWRVPKADLGNLSGRFIELDTGANEYHWEDYNPTFVQFAGYTVSGTVSIDGDPDGKILLYLFDGQDPDSSELLASTVLDATGSYTLENLPHMGDTFCWLYVIWDKDGNGTVSIDDAYGYAYFQINGDVEGVDVSADHTIDFTLTGSVMNVHLPDDTFATYLDVYIEDFNDGILPDDIDSITYHVGPGGTPIAILDDPNIEITRYSDSAYDFFIAVPGQPDLNDYTFTVTSGNATRTTTDTQSVIRKIPLPDVSSFYPQPGGTVSSYTPLFAWNPVEYGSLPLYYRLQILDTWDNIVYSTSRTLNMTSHLVPSGILWNGQSYYWRVRVTDSGNWLDVENRSHSAWQPFTMAYQLYSDSDGDGLLDNVEDTNQNGTVDAGETDPNDADSDNDGIIDGLEDWNRNGIVDAGETDPRVGEFKALPSIHLLLLGD